MNADPKWVKAISPLGAVRHMDWRSAYGALQQAARLPDVGYLWHEAAVWCKETRRWLFLPRRESSEKYDEEKVRARMGEGGREGGRVGGATGATDPPKAPAATPRFAARKCFPAPRVPPRNVAQGGTGDVRAG